MTTTAAKHSLAVLPARTRRRSCDERGQSGQSIVEFLLAVPVMVGITLLMMRVNTVIQMSIVNQKYARSHALFLAHNNNTYPGLQFMSAQFHEKGMNQMIIGVAENAPDDASSSYVPKASSYKLGSRSPGASDDRGDVERRDDVRVRDTVTLCTQTNVINAGGSYKALLDLGPDPAFAPSGIWRYTETMAFDYCRAPGGIYAGGGAGG